MGPSFPGFRVFVFGMICLFAFIVMFVAAAEIHSTVESIAPLAGLTIATSILTLIGLPTFLAISRHGHGVEITSLVLLWVLWLSVGADATSVKSRLVFAGDELFLRQRSIISDAGMLLCHLRVK
ncbi:hypothetical protein PILCRDRAFT_684849 [Piloderma croceum F 1598]|uniref:Uncharacterized protein n=1 Tax=Piloderma croceum (strain F 1598) TaxID=765440 RepID=A0A0C3AMM3_PILCF|nr:hypothetical protein PILCRDRAFT_684849 [Piloderma croceum F 1598]